MIRLQIVTEQWNPISAAIRYTTRSWASHVEFVNTVRQTTLGARSIGGVKFRPCAKDHYTRVEHFVVADYKIMESAYAWGLTQIGKKYDFSAVTGIRLDQDWHNSDKWFCSEFIHSAFIHADYPLLSTRPSDSIWRVTPRDLLLSRQLYWLDSNVYKTESDSPK